jgi:hypothetical protein
MYFVVTTLFINRYVITSLLLYIFEMLIIYLSTLILFLLNL